MAKVAPLTCIYIYIYTPLSGMIENDTQMVSWWDGKNSWVYHMISKTCQHQCSAFPDPKIFHPPFASNSPSKSVTFATWKGQVINVFIAQPQPRGFTENQRLQWLFIVIGKKHIILWSFSPKHPNEFCKLQVLLQNLDLPQGYLQIDR